MKRIKYFLKAGVWSWIVTIAFLGLLYPPFKYPVDTVDHYFLWSQWALLPVSLFFAIGYLILARRRGKT